jgi:uncharacterized membrane protein
MSEARCGCQSSCARVCALGGIFLLIAKAQAQPVYRIVPLPDAVPNTGFRVLEMDDVNSSGASVGVFTIRGGGIEDVKHVMVNPEMKTSFLPIPAGDFDSAGLINNAGVVVATAGWMESNGDLVKRAARVDTAGQFTYLDLPEGVRASTAIAVNNSGVVVGLLYRDPYGIGLAAKWDADGRVSFLSESGTQPGDTYRFGFVRGINDSGVSVGHALKWVNGESHGSTAVRWNPDGHIVPFPESSAPQNSIAYAINNSGIVIGYRGERAFRWDASDAIVTLEDRPEWLGRGIVDIDDTGFVVGNVGLRDLPWDRPVDRAVIWDLEGHAFELTDLVVSDHPVTVNWVAAISDNGIILAETSEGWALLYPVPEPGPVTALLAGAASLLTRRRCRRQSMR